MQKLRFILNYVFQLILLTLLVLKFILFSKITSQSIGEYQLLSNIIITIFILSLLDLLFRSNKWISLFSTYSLISLLLFSNIVYFSYFGDFITFSSLSHIKQLPQVMGATVDTIKSSYLIFILDVPFSILLTFTFRNSFKKSKLIFNILKIIVCISFLVLILNKIFMKDKDLLKAEFSKQAVNNEVGILGMYLNKGIKNFTTSPLIKKIDASSLANINDQFKDVPISPSNYKGKNIIMIQVESLQDFVINKKYNSREITPNLNKLLKESTYFDNVYYQVGCGHTSDSEMVANTSLFPFEDNCAYTTKSNNTFIGLSNYLKDLNYSTYAFHGNKASFWNRLDIYRKFSFDEFFSFERLKKDDVKGMGVSDLYLFIQTFDILKNTKNPFFAFTITLTSHSPFDTANNFTEKKDFTENYFNSINYTDKALGEFIDKLSQSSLLDNSILLIYGDHNAYTLNNIDDLGNAIDEKITTNTQWQKYQKVPLIIRLPDKKFAGQVFKNSVGQIDILPTLAQLLSIANVKAFGENIFDFKNHLVILRNGDYIYGNTYYDKLNNKTFNLNNGELLANSDSLIKQSEEKLKASDDIFRYNLLGKLLKREDN